MGWAASETSFRPWPASDPGQLPAPPPGPAAARLGTAARTTQAAWAQQLQRQQAGWRTDGAAVQLARFGWEEAAAPQAVLSPLLRGW